MMFSRISKQTYLLRGAESASRLTTSLPVALRPVPRKRRDTEQKFWFCLSPETILRLTLTPKEVAVHDIVPPLQLILIHLLHHPLLSFAFPSWPPVTRRK